MKGFSHHFHLQDGRYLNLPLYRLLSSSTMEITLVHTTLCWTPIGVKSICGWNVQISHIMYSRSTQNHWECSAYWQSTYVAAFSDASKAFESNSRFSMDDDTLRSRTELWSFNQGNSCSGVNVPRHASQLVTADCYSPDFEVVLLFFKLTYCALLVYHWCGLCPQSIYTAWKLCIHEINMLGWQLPTRNVSQTWMVQMTSFLYRFMQHHD